LAASLSSSSTARAAAAAAGRVGRCHADVTASTVRRLLRHISRHLLNRRHVHAADAARQVRQQVSRPSASMSSVVQLELSVWSVCVRTITFESYSVFCSFRLHIVSRAKLVTVTGVCHLSSSVTLPYAT